MSDEYISHPIYNKYEAARDGTIRNKRLKKRIGIINNAGYLQIGVYNTSGKIKSYRVHRFITEVFHGKIPPGYVVDHIDGNKTNNHVDNLRIVTPRENQLNKITVVVNVTPKPVTARVRGNENTDFSQIYNFPSLNSAENYFDVNSASVRRSAEGIISSTWSKKFNCKVSFMYT